MVSQAANLSSATGLGESAVCPGGLFAGLTYVPNVAPDVRRTGTLARPCLVGYGNF